MHPTTSTHPSNTLHSLVEHSSLPMITVKARGGTAQLQAYVNAYIVGRDQAFMHGHWGTPLYYLSLVAMKGQGTTLQGIFARLVSTHSKDVSIEGIGDVALAHHQSSLAECGYTLHWNFEQAEVLPNHDLHAVIESHMLTICDPIRGNAVKQREQRTGKSQQSQQGKRQKERVSLSTAKGSKVQQSLAEIRNREKHPMFLLMVPGWVQEEDFCHQLHLSFLDPRLPWPLDPSWASFLWERGIRHHEIERLKVWCFTAPEPEPGETEEEPHHERSVPLFSMAYLCRPQPAQMQQDLQEAILSHRLSSLLSCHLVTLPLPEQDTEQESIALVATPV